MITLRVESTSRWDALALTGRLAHYRWYLIEPDACHWNVCVPLEQPTADLPDELRATITSWLHERRLEKAVIHTEVDDYVIERDPEHA